MKTLGLVRKVDTLGRIVVPIEVRRMLDIDIHDPVEMFMEGDAVIVKKYSPHCIFCGKSDDITEYKGKRICRRCMKEIVYESNQY